MSLQELLLILGGLALILLLYTVFLHLKVARFLRGKNAHSLEDTIQELIAHNNHLIIENQKSKDRLTTLEDKAKKSIRTIQTVRFNPFSDAGSNQSFATSLVSEEGNGVVLSSLYSRDRVSIFAKPIMKFGSEYELSGEEKEVLTRSAETYQGN